MHERQAQYDLHKNISLLALHPFIVSFNEQYVSFLQTKNKFVLLLTCLLRLAYLAEIGAEASSAKSSSFLCKLKRILLQLCLSSYQSCVDLFFSIEFDFRKFNYSRRKSRLFYKSLSILRSNDSETYKTCSGKLKVLIPARSAIFIFYSFSRRKHVANRTIRFQSWSWIYSWASDCHLKILGNFGMTLKAWKIYYTLIILRVLVAVEKTKKLDWSLHLCIHRWHRVRKERALLHPLTMYKTKYLGKYIIIKWWKLIMKQNVKIMLIWLPLLPISSLLVSLAHPWYFSRNQLKTFPKYLQILLHLPSCPIML